MKVRTKKSIRNESQQQKPPSEQRVMYNAKARRYAEILQWFLVFTVLQRERELQACVFLSKQEEIKQGYIQYVKDLRNNSEQLVTEFAQFSLKRPT